MHDRIARLESKNKEYLDLFCGTGHDIQTFADVAMTSEGLETSQEALQLLEESLNDLAAKNQQIEFLKAEVQKC